MCGRFTLTSTPATLRELFGIPVPEGASGGRFNVAPTQGVAVILNREPREVRLLRWGLIPSWAKDPAIGNRMINARAETLAEKPSFRSAFRHRRCLILADGFYEWRKEGKAKVPLWIHPVDGKPLAFAGLWETWTSPDGEVVDTCTIVTCESNELMRPFHHRMPVILDPKDHDRWLEPGPVDPEALRDLLVPCPPERLAIREVSTRVNNPRNNGPDLLEPA